MRIGIDARFYGSIGKGLGRYTQKLIEHLEKIDAENQYYVFLRRENFEEYKPQNKNFKKVLADYRWYSFAEQISFPALLYKYRLDLMHFPHFNVPILYPGKFVITIHDLILLHFPTKRATTLQPCWYWIKFRAYKFAIFTAIHRACKVITVSQFTKNDILSQYDIDKKKIVVTYEACDQVPENQKESQGQVLEKYGIIKPYLLYVGNAYPHKNLERLVVAFDAVRKEIPDLNLVLVGKDDYFYARIKKFVLEKKIRQVNFPGFVDDLELDSIYRSSLAYIFPSLYEGFGLPPLEAMSRGIPVISSRSACLPEILGESAHFVDCENESAITSAIVKIFKDERLRTELVAKGYGRIKKYSWNSMAQETLAVYQNKDKY